MIIASIYPFPCKIGGAHDPNFSLLKDGEIYSCEEGKTIGRVLSANERFPELSMMAGFKQLGISAEDVDIWVFGNPSVTSEKESLVSFFSQFKTKSYEELSESRNIRFVDHHLSHIALGVYGSGFDNGCFLSLDGGGDEADLHDSAWGIFDGNNIDIRGKSEDNWGLSQFHNFICEAIGYLRYIDNGKLMGLSAYGRVNEDLYKELKQFLKISPDGFSANFKKLNMEKRSPYQLHKLKLDAYQRFKVIHAPNPPKELTTITKYFSGPDIAATGQKIFEDVLLEIVKNILQQTGRDYLVCTGGSFQNVSFNRKLLDLGLKGVYIPSAPIDAGLSLGAALYVNMSIRNSRPKSYISPYLGPSFTENEVEELLKEHKLVYTKSDNISFDTARFISEGKIVGWFQGRSELGPRALGARSVLADPRNLTNKAKVNQLLKRRDWFMPYAPSVLFEEMEELFGTPLETPYMAFALKVKEELMSKIPAAIHVDGTSRPNSVKREDNPKYYELIKEFKRLTGIPAVLNTSFNRHGIATIVTPRQAIEHLFNGCIEILAIEDFIVYPEINNAEKDSKIYEECYYLLVEEVKPIIEAIVMNDESAEKIVNCSKHKLKSYGIEFDLLDKCMLINGHKIQLKVYSRNELRDQLFPIFGAEEKYIWK